MVKEPELFHPAYSVVFFLFVVFAIFLSLPRIDESYLQEAKMNPAYFDSIDLNQSPRKMYVAAQSLYQAGHRTEAIRLLDEMLFLYPEHEDLFPVLLSWMDEAGVTAESIQRWLTMIRESKIKPTIETLGTLIDLLIWQGLQTEAQEMIRFAFQSNSQSKNAWNELFEKSRVLGNRNLILEFIRAGYQNQWITPEIRASLYFQFRDLEFVAGTLGLQTREDLRMWVLGLSDAELKKEKDILISYAWDQQSLRLLSFLGEKNLLTKVTDRSVIGLYLESRAFKTAYEYLRGYLQRHVLSDSEWHDVVDVLIQMKKNKEAEKILKDLIRNQQPELSILFSPSYFNLFFHWITFGTEFSEARTKKTESRRNNKSHIQKLLQLYDSQGKQNEAIQLLEESIQNYPSLRMNLAQRYSWKGSPQQALRILESLPDSEKKHTDQIFQAIVMADVGREEESRKRLNALMPIPEDLDEGLKKRVQEILKNEGYTESWTPVLWSRRPFIETEAYRWALLDESLTGLNLRYENRFRTTLEYGIVSQSRIHFVAGLVGYAWRSENFVVSVDTGYRNGGDYSNFILRSNFQFFTDILSLFGSFDSSRVLFSTPVMVQRGLSEASLELGGQYLLSSYFDLSGTIRFRVLSEHQKFNQGKGLDSDLRFGVGPKKRWFRIGPWWYRTRWSSGDPTLNSVLLTSIEFLGAWSRLEVGNWDTPYHSGVTVGAGKELSAQSNKISLGFVEYDFRHRFRPQSNRDYNTLGFVFGYYGNALNTSLIRGNYVAKIETKIHF